MKYHLIVLSFLLLAFSAQSQKAEIFKKDGAAIGGYDAVAFFLMQKPVKGLDKFSIEWKGANWHFSSKENAAAFAAAPEKYAPQYGGYCALGMAGGYKAPTEIDTWRIVDDKLYFNYNQRVKDQWSTDLPGYIKKADLNWPAIKEKG